MKNDRQTAEKNKQALSLKSMYFNRYLIVRYATALFFFTNLYWLAAMVLSQSVWLIVPAGLMLIYIASMAEQVKIYSRHTNDAKYTRLAFRAQLITNLLLLTPVAFLSSFTQLYPFLSSETQAQAAIFVILTAGIAISALVLRRLTKIRTNEDKHYQRIKQYEEVLN
ncbi:hypothetical protein [Salisediminibacterium halotolerans]|uniref:hypothetical protein n=1 Tax=Salisediminibacterium halotolerans TaxID=517425 RepID=UPI000EB45F37|nr:hypothetical protein [Salisediminibacterium halotolerans]RLJ75687.1 hypothetical protein BCL39_1205 [Actinophytocola xinjiangensis]RPE89541.1 hypothetical protein EDD67_0318 [Salisediminibacterium halotolerans]TWG36300.1 hypothetical protein BCL52_1202 [Salisediminibacterium halotolerans]GEL09165.1 hypothetical protein SHA02_25810 [Salisediminibacterium halotolerans]